MDCPTEHGAMKIDRRAAENTFRWMVVRYDAEFWACDVCGLEVEVLRLAAENQRALSDGYRIAADLLPGREIVEERKRLGWSQDELAKAIKVGVASVKRWERGQIQTPVMDRALRAAFDSMRNNCDFHTGNRLLSLGRIKLVLMNLGNLLGRDLLGGRANRLLYPAKYLWYADMLSFRETGQSMTGATYAALPRGPQINNYTELIELIRLADETKEEPITDHEKRILHRIAMTFPTNKTVYDASHREDAFKSKRSGTLIPYSDAHTLTGI